MGGGGQNSSPPVDVAPGGGTYPTDAFGSAYNPAWQSNFNWGTLGQGLQRTGSAYGQSGGGAGSYMSGVQYPASPNNPASVPNTLVPQSRGKDEETRALMDAIRRMQATQAAAKSIVPDKGAAKYWYVDPRAIGYDPMAAYNDEQGHDIANLGLLPAGTQPSF